MVLLGCIEFGTYDWISCAAWRIQICCVKMKSLLYFRSACLWLAFHASHIRCWTTPGWDCKMLTRSSFSRWWGGCGGTGPKFLDSMVVATWETWCDSFCDRCQSFCHLPSQGDYPRKCVGVPPDSGEGGRADQEEPSGEPWLQKGLCFFRFLFFHTFMLGHSQLYRYHISCNIICPYLGFAILGHSILTTRLLWLSHLGLGQHMAAHWTGGESSSSWCRTMCSGQIWVKALTHLSSRSLDLWRGLVPPHGNLQFSEFVCQLTCLGTVCFFIISVPHAIPKPRTSLLLPYNHFAVAQDRRRRDLARIANAQKHLGLV